MSRQKVIKPTIRVERYINSKAEGHADVLREFSEKMGRAIKGTGTTYSVGSMIMTVLGGTEVRKSLNRLSAPDRSKLDLKSLSQGLEEKLRDSRPREAELEVEGLGFYGTAIRRGYGDQAKLALKLCKPVDLINDDIECAQEYMSDNKLPELRVPIDREDHLTFGEVWLSRLVMGRGENPNMLVPRRAIIPETIALCGIGTEIIGQEY